MTYRVLRLLLVATSLITAFSLQAQDGMIEADSMESSIDPTAATGDSTPDSSAEVSGDEPLTDPNRLVGYQTRIAKRLDRYMELDSLIWWASDSNIPALLTTNPSGTPLADVGRLDRASTSIVYGEQKVGDWPHAGVRLRFGRYFRNRMASRIELGLLWLFEGSESFRADSSSGSPILARPFFNSATSVGSADAQILSSPGLADGSFTSDYRRQAVGLEPLVFTCLVGGRSEWLEGYFGYRFFWLRDQLTLRERLVPAPGGLIAPGTRFEVEDDFRADNFYHLLPLGLSWTGNRNRWRWNLRGEVGVGVVDHRIRIRGRTDSYSGGTLVDTRDAGLLALATNSGTHRRTRFAWVPRLSFALHRSMTDTASVSFGYTMTILNDAVQAANHVPTTIDSENIPPVSATAGVDPRFAYQNGTVLVHGINLGLRLDY